MSLLARLNPAALFRDRARRRAILWAVVFGVLGALAMPPVHVLLLLVVSLSGLAWLIDRAPTRRGAFAVGWWWGFGHFSAGLYWIANAMLVDPVRFGWMIPFAVFGLGGVLGFFPGLAALAARLVPAGFLRILTLAAAWAAMEWLRGWIFTGFPWNLMATVWLPVLPVAQFTSVVGAYGLAVPTVLAAASPCLLLHFSRKRAAMVAGTWALVLVIGLWGLVRMSPVDSVPGVRLRVVQGNIEQTLKWKPELRAQHLMEYVALSSEPGREKLSAVIWPETAVPYFIDYDERVRAVVASAAPPKGLVLTGAPRMTPPGQEPLRLWNSLQAVDADGGVANVFDKVHLVPFGEYMPLRGILPLAKLTAGATDFTPGDGLLTISLPGLPSFSPTICYEDIFPGEVAPSAPRPYWLLNITNDGWFGISAGPYQHFAAARLRAIEEGLPMVRAANTGISGVVDPYGRVVAEIALGERGYVDSDLPQRLEKSPPFAKWGNLVLLLVEASIALINLISLRTFVKGDHP